MPSDPHVDQIWGHPNDRGTWRLITGVKQGLVEWVVFGSDVKSWCPIKNWHDIVQQERLVEIVTGEKTGFLFEAFDTDLFVIVADDEDAAWSAIPEDQKKLWAIQGQIDLQQDGIYRVYSKPRMPLIPIHLKVLVDGAFMEIGVRLPFVPTPETRLRIWDDWCGALTVRTITYKLMPSVIECFCEYQAPADLTADQKKAAFAERGWTAT